VDLEILPEPSDEERQAIVTALRLEAEEDRDPTPWRGAVDPNREPYATAPRRRDAGIVDP
jgi:hypothetical protein